MVQLYIIYNSFNKKDRRVAIWDIVQCNTVKAVRRNYSKMRHEIELPDLIEIQTKSFDWFVTDGLTKLFEDISPIRIL